MKRFLLTILPLLVPAYSHGQNTFTNSGANVGVGTANPITLFNVVVPFAKTSTRNSSVPSFLSTNDASAPFGLRTMIYGATNIANRYVTLQTADYGLLDGGSIMLNLLNKK